MPSDVTGRRVCQRNHSMSHVIRSGARAVLPALLIVLLPACSTGTQEESRTAATREATRGALLPEIQATNVFEEFFGPTGTPGATMTPLPSLGTLTLTTQVDAENRPRGEVGSVRQGGTVFAVAELNDLSAGQTVTAVWATPEGAEVARNAVAIDRDTSSTWLAFEWVATGVSSGDYAVFLFIDSELINSLVFTVN